MLNRAKVLEQLQDCGQNLFFDYSNELILAQRVWNEIINDPLFIYKIQSISHQFLIPHWNDDLKNVQEINAVDSYQILGIDGSQIYPDRHQGTACFLINIGSVLMRYGSYTHRVELQSKPYLYIVSPEKSAESLEDIVNCRRQELEFDRSMQIIQELNTKPDLLLFDGSLIFWHLEGKSEAIKQEFINRYIRALDQCYKEEIFIAGYISLPKNKELVNLIRLSMQLQNNQNTIDHLVDTHIASFFLESNCYTTIFEHQSAITAYYPAHLKPYFCYFKSDYEIIRIEIPQWIACNPLNVKHVINLIADQIKKGQGYPVCLAEAHEQAVVKGPDRDFFYQCIQKLSIEYKQRISHSQKSIKKRGMNV